MVSTETTAPPAASSRITGTTRPSSSSTRGRVAPGRVDSPPMSSTSAPSESRWRPWTTAASGVAHRPPSEKESGVTFTTPINRGSVIDRGTSRATSPPLAVDQRHRLGPGRRVVHLAADRRGDGARAGLAHAPHGHAQVLRLDHDDHTARIQGPHERIGHLRGQPLLHLWALGEDVDETGQL